MAASFAPPRTPSPLVHWWAAKPANERRIAVALAAVVVAALAWWLVWQPMTRDIAGMKAAQARDATALAEAKKMSAEAAGLARNPRAPPATAARADLERVLSQQGLRATQSEWQDGRARVVLADVRFDALVAALEALQRDARLRVVEATLTARVEPGAVRAELVLAR